jgi:hypothetical protein
MKNAANIPVDNPSTAFLNFQVGLSRALRVSKEEMEQRIARDDAERATDRIRNGRAKRGPKPKL